MTTACAIADSLLPRVLIDTSITTGTQRVGASIQADRDTVTVHQDRRWQSPRFSFGFAYFAYFAFAFAYLFTRAGGSNRGTAADQ